MDDRDSAGLLGLLAEVLQHRTLHHVYQPIWSLPHGTLLGYEALARPPGGTVPEALWDLAAATPWWPELDLLALERALRGGRHLPGRLFLNVSARFLELEGETRERALSLFARYRPRLDTVALEITETALTDAIRASAGARFWQGRGVALALDDAGTGASLPERVPLLRPDFVKIDRELTRRWAGGEPEPLLQWSSWARTIGAGIIAEGVEDRHALAGLTLLTPLAVQGFALGPPRPPEAWTPEEMARWAPPGPPAAVPAGGPPRPPALPEADQDAWFWRRHRRTERLLALARDLTVPVLVAGWFLHPAHHLPLSLPPLLAGAAGIGWSLGATWYTGRHREVNPWWGYGSTAADAFWTAAWIAATGGRVSPYLPLLFWQVLWALIRLPRGAAAAAITLLVGLYALETGAVNTMALYLAVMVGTIAVWKRLFEKEADSQVRDSETGWLAREYGTFLLEQALRAGTAVAAILLDVDPPPGGDSSPEPAVLRTLGSLCEATLSGEHALIRYSGREVLVLCPACDPGTAAGAADRLRQAVSHTAFPLWGQHGRLHLTISAGVAVACPGTGVQALLEAAEAALAQAAARRNATVTAAPAG
ncbi:MAG: EAL domain-containing protein [Firmicutes bacterium]|nr:EAL domain-containing protein [Bacillota bacterium]